MDLGFDDLLAKAQSPSRPSVASLPLGSGGVDILISKDKGMGSTEGNVFCVSCIAENEVCGGRIGAGGTFCARSAGACKVKSHKLVSHEFSNDDPSYYVMKAGDVGFANPSLSASKVSTKLRQEWIGLSLSSTEWVKLFAIAGGGPEAATQESVNEGLQAKDNADHYKTPAKPKQATSMEDVERESAFASFYSPFKPSILMGLEKEELKDPLNPETMQSNILDLENGLMVTGKRLTVVSDYFEHELSSKDDILQTVALKSESAFEMIGKAPRGFPLRFQAPDLWGTISLIIDSLLDTGTEDTLSKVVQEAIESSGNGLKDSIISLQNNARSLFKVLINRIITIEEKVFTLESIQTDNDQGTKSLDENPFGSLFPSDSHATAQTPMMDNIIKRLEKVEAEQKDSTIRFTKQLGLSSLEETKAWMILNFPSRCYGLFMDVFVFLDRMAGDSDTDQASMLTTMDKQVRLKLKTGSEAMSLGALRSPIPKILHSPTGTTMFGTGKHKSFLNRLPQHTSWSDGSHGMKYWMIQRIPIMRKSVMDDIHHTLPRGSIAHSAATDGLSRTIAWITLLVSFIDVTYESLHLHSKFSPEQAWCLLSQLITRVFADIARCREGVLMSLRTEDEDNTCASILWTTFRTHDAMDEFFDSNIADHPSISSEYVKFLASNSGSDATDKLEIAVGKLMRDLKTTTEALSVVSRKADTASNLVDTLKRKVTSLENHPKLK